MKLLLVLAVVLLGAWLWRSGRQAQATQNRKPAPPPPALEMVSCALCDVHLPLAEAVPGQHGMYCSLEHRQRAEP